MGGPKIPWSIIAPYEQEAQRNHGQTLQELASRGGLSPCEAVAVIECRAWYKMPASAALDRLEDIIRQRYYLPTIDRLTAALAAAERERDEFSRCLGGVTWWTELKSAQQRAEAAEARLFEFEKKLDAIVDAVYGDISDGENVEDVVVRIKRERDDYKRCFEEQSEMTATGYAERDAHMKARTEITERFRAAEMECRRLREQLAQADTVIARGRGYDDTLTEREQWYQQACQRHAARKRVEEDAGE